MLKYANSERRGSEAISDKKDVEDKRKEVIEVIKERGCVESENIRINELIPLIDEKKMECELFNEEESYEGLEEKLREVMKIESGSVFAMMTRGRVNDVEGKVINDTGAQVSVISEEIVIRLDLSNNVRESKIEW